jgi:aminocarboxymuconate-semialdehyde decarboxylase
MESAGVDVQVLSASPQLPYSDDREAAITAAVRLNDWHAEVVSRHPDRLRAFACTPMPHIDASLAKIERALGALGIAGVTMTTSVLGQTLTEPWFAPIFQELERRGAVLYLHPVGNRACSSLIGDQLTWMPGAPIETRLLVLSSSSPASLPATRTSRSSFPTWVSAARTPSRSSSKSNSGVWTPMTTNPCPPYLSAQVRT